MIRWLQKSDGSRVLQEKHPSPMFPEWYDVPTEVEKPEPRKPREAWLIQWPNGQIGVYADKQADAVLYREVIE